MNIPDEWLQAVFEQPLLLLLQIIYRLKYMVAPNNSISEICQRIQSSLPITTVGFQNSIDLFQETYTFL